MSTNLVLHRPLFSLSFVFVPLRHHSAFVSLSYTLLRLETNQFKKSEREAVCGWRYDKTACLDVVTLAPKQHDSRVPIPYPVTSPGCPAHHREDDKEGSKC